LVKRLRENGGKLPAVLYEGLRWLTQLCAERRNAYVRVQNLHLDRRLDRVLAFSGRGEWGPLNRFRCVASVAGTGGRLAREQVKGKRRRFGTLPGQIWLLIGSAGDHRSFFYWL